MLYQVLYSSLATELISAHAMRDLLDHARARNAARGITGVLIYSPASCEIVQVLEGEKAAVLVLMEGIQADSRHRRVVVHYEATICARDLGAWPMGYLLAQCDEPAPRAGGATGSRNSCAATHLNGKEAIGLRLLQFARGAAPKRKTVH